MSKSPFLRELEQRISEMAPEVARRHDVSIAIEVDERSLPSVAVRVVKDGSGRVVRRRDGRRI
jgi:hypothetical protein